MRRYFRIFSLVLACLAAPFARANQDMEVNLDAEVGSYCSNVLDGFGDIRFVVDSKTAHTALVTVYFRSDLNNQAILFFKENMAKNQLDKSKPKVKIAKNQEVMGMPGRVSSSSPIMPAAPMMAVTNLSVETGKKETFMLPFYVASYKTKDYPKKSKNDLKYEILDQVVITAIIHIQSWSEATDPEYLEMRDRIERFINSLKGVSFCENTRHKPTLSQQKKPYEDQLNTLKSDFQVLWAKVAKEDMSSDARYKAYKQLKDSLDGINLDSRIGLCKNHSNTPVPPKPKHSCGYCNASAAELSQKMERLYQQVKAGKITYAQAKSQGSAIISCYNKNSRRKKNNNAKARIDKYYDLINK